jgi:diguanylate cyclase (GGDEF)-like protein
VDDIQDMDGSRSALMASDASTFDSEDAHTTWLQRSGALAVCAFLAVATLLAALLGNGHGPESKTFVAITATTWSLADMLTAFLLLSQFYANGSVFIGLTASAYLVTGLLTWPYLWAFPGVVRLDALSIADDQTSIYLWLVWHATFPALILCATLYDSALGRIVSRRKIQIVSSLLALVPLFFTSAISALVFAYHDVLPNLLVDGTFQPVFRKTFVPIVMAFDVLACIALVARKKQTALALCVALAMFSAALDTFLNTQTGWYTYAWDAGKLVTVFTATVVLVMILCEIAGVYGRLARVATIDVLTSLHNRRAFEEHLRLVFRNARRLRRTLSLLVVDIDHFKIFNDTYGHLAGDQCLRSVAQAMAGCVTRPLDLIARYGGEEFVVVLPETSLAGVFVVAQCIRAAVEALEIAIDGRPSARVTVSIGIGYVTDASMYGETLLFAAADRGLYEAKDRGRNRVVLGTAEGAVKPRSAAREVTV